MEYKKVKAHLLSVEEFREIWKNEYCLGPIQTFDSVMVFCYEDMFDHVFFESANRIKGDKSILSLNRLEKIHWIKAALQDPDAILKSGWDKSTKSYFDNRRISIVKGNYVVVIMFTGYLKAKLITAYEKDEIENIMRSPDFDKNSKYLKK
jgi:hypothetical protein